MLKTLTRLKPGENERWDFSGRKGYG